MSGAAGHRKGTVKRLMRSAAMAVLSSSAPNSDALITLPIPRASSVSLIVGFILVFIGI